MFYDKDSMLEMFELSLGKKEWKHLLITTELFGSEFTSLTTKEIVAMHYAWKESIKKIINTKDAAYVINQGNIFCLTKDANVNHFKNELNRMVFHSAKHQGGIRCSLTFLTNEETEFLLKMS